MKSQENRMTWAAKSAKSVKLAKVYLTVAITAVALSFSACAADVDQAASVKPDTTNTIKAQTTEGTQQETSKIKIFVGSVSNKIGNDLTVSLGEFVMDKGSGDQQVMRVDENGVQTLVDGASTENEGGVVFMMPMPDGDAASEGSAGGSGDPSGGESASNGPIDKMPIEFTGEVKDFTIPAGASIVNAMGQEITLDQIVQGSIVQLIVDEATGVVERILVM